MEMTHLEKLEKVGISWGSHAACAPYKSGVQDCGFLFMKTSAELSGAAADQEPARGQGACPLALRQP